MIKQIRNQIKYCYRVYNNWGLRSRVKSINYIRNTKQMNIYIMDNIKTLEKTTKQQRKKKYAG